MSKAIALKRLEMHLDTWVDPITKERERIKREIEELDRHHQIEEITEIGGLKTTGKMLVLLSDVLAIVEVKDD
jgi:hypothetical protein